MTQHLLQEHTEQDQLIVRRLATVIGSFIAFTAILAITIGAIMG